MGRPIARLDLLLASKRKPWSRSVFPEGETCFGTKKWIDARYNELEDTCILLLGRRKRWAGTYRLRKDMERFFRDEY